MESMETVYLNIQVKQRWNLTWLHLSNYPWTNTTNITLDRERIEWCLEELLGNRSQNQIYSDSRMWGSQGSHWQCIPLDSSKFSLANTWLCSSCWLQKTNLPEFLQPGRCPQHQGWFWSKFYTLCSDFLFLWSTRDSALLSQIWGKNFSVNQNFKL